MTCIILPLHKYCYRKKIKREVWFSSLRKKVPKSSTKKPFTFFYFKLVEVPGVVRGILKTLWQNIGEYEIFFSLCYLTPIGFLKNSAKCCPTVLPAIANAYVYILSEELHFVDNLSYILDQKNKKNVKYVAQKSKKCKVCGLKKHKM